MYPITKIIMTLTLPVSGLKVGVEKLQPVKEKEWYALCGPYDVLSELDLIDGAVLPLHMGGIRYRLVAENLSATHAMLFREIKGVRLVACED